MRVILKYLFINIAIVISAVLLLSYTPFGNALVYNYIGHQLSKKADLNITVESIDLHNYPIVDIDLDIEEKAKLSLHGTLYSTWLNMQYVLTSNCISTDVCTINDDVSIKGEAIGAFDSLYITGKGKAFDGNVTYRAIKYPTKFEYVNVLMHDVNSSKLFTLLGQESIVEPLMGGKANTEINFDIMEEEYRKGTITYSIKNNNHFGFPLNMYTKINIDDVNHTFSIDINSPYLTLKIQEGEYNQENSKIEAFYTLDIKDLSQFEMLFGYKYQGEFFSKGKINYDEYLSITGITRSFNGIMDYTFEKKGLWIDLDDVSLKQVMTLFPIPSTLDADATGKMYYNFVANTFLVNAKLNNAKFLPCDLVDIFYKKTGIKLQKETFNNSILDASYHDGIIAGNLRLHNKKNHLNLKHAQINTNKNTLSIHFDMYMKREGYLGKVYGSLDEPSVNLNLSKLIKHKVENRFDKVIGKKNRENIEKMIKSIPLGKAAEDVVSDAASSFIKMLF
ncbi:MAG: Unknown protein [uncultured Sulfurovum sp.]|uniref:AsmA-like C-terminal domain-containing protein n=1 Tax=uncultured Sulfurovum sp. TaxID=269237 RepID=A0A6S6UF27_9BACT|nr:MAG: Unknown protein [uncultured Sulfurovum sp.]